VFVDSGSGWIRAYSPAMDKFYNLSPLSEWGPGGDVFQHPATIYNPEKRGWTCIATYSQATADQKWSANQIFMIEIADTNRRIVRISPNYNIWWKGDKNKSYFGEGFASFDYAGNNIYWGANWM